MVLINEWLPNPAGSDTTSEWIELFNNSSEQANLNGWVLAAKSGSKFSLNGKTITAGGYLLLPRSETKLVLKNQDEAIALYDSSGKLADETQFVGTAPEGKSFSKAGDGTFVFMEPTPGKENAIIVNNLSAADNYPKNMPLNSSIGAGELSAIILGAAAVIAGLIVLVLKRHENLSKFFFGKN